MSRPSITLALLALLGVARAQNDPVFLLETGSPILIDGQDSRAIVPGDMNADGLIDLFVANFAQKSIVYRNLGGGQFEIMPPFNLNLPQDASFDAAWGDMDGDGDLDLAVANGSKNLIPGGGTGTADTLWKNIGPIEGGGIGRFAPIAGAFGTDLGETYGVAWADVDGDHDLDLLFVNRLQPNVMYLNDGAGHFTKVATGPFVTDTPNTSRALAVGDLDGDLDADVVVANSNGLPNFVYINQGGSQGGTQGEFLRLTGDPAAEDTGECYGVSLGDYDRDGDLDLFVSRRYGEGNLLYRNDGTAHFTPMPSLAPSLDAGDSYRSAWGDLDRDGDVDLVVANRDEDEFLYFNNGDGTFRKASVGQVVHSGGDSRMVAIADLDGDAFPEILVANTLGGDDFHFRNHGRTFKNVGFAYHPGPSTPQLSADGTLGPSTPLSYRVTLGPQSSSGILVAGFTSIFAPFKGGTLVPAPDIILAGFTTNASGALGFQTTFPSGVPAGLSVFHQMWFIDAGSPSGFSASNGLAAFTP